MTLPQRSTPAVPPAAPEPLRRLPVTLRPDPKLLTYYLLASLLAGPAFPVLMVVLYFRYHTLRYDVDDEGLTMRWGILFRREVSLTYARIQDIHLTSNVVERYLGLARVQLQTASSSAQAEMNIEGLPFFEPMRDFLYARMRGAREEQPQAAVSGAQPRAAVSGEQPQAAVPGAQPQAAPGAQPRAVAPGAQPPDALAAALREVAAELRALRAELGGRQDG